MRKQTGVLMYDWITKTFILTCLGGSTESGSYFLAATLVNDILARKMQEL